MKSNQLGAGLLESLVASTIISICTSVLLFGLKSGTQLFSSTIEKHHCTILAKSEINKLWYACLEGTFLGDTLFTSEIDNRKYQVERLNNKLGNKSVIKTTITVSPYNKKKSIKSYHFLQTGK